MDPTTRRTLTNVVSDPALVGTTASKTSASFKGNPEAVKNRLIRAQAISQGLNRQLGNLLHFINQSSYLVLESEKDRPQEILWVAAKQTNHTLEEASDNNLRDKIVKELSELPSELRVQVEKVLDNPSQKVSANTSTTINIPDQTYSANSGWSFDVLLLRTDQEVIPEATISYPAIRLNEDGDVCFFADVYPQKLLLNSATALRQQTSSQQTSLASPDDAHSIDVAQLFWNALQRAGIKAKMTLDIIQD